MRNLGLYGGRREENKRRRREEKRKRRRNLGLEHLLYLELDISSLEIVWITRKESIEIPLCLSCVGAILLELLLVGIR